MILASIAISIEWQWVLWKVDRIVAELGLAVVGIIRLSVPSVDYRVDIVCWKAS